MTKPINKDYSISIYLDTRRTKDSGKHPVKLRVFVKSIKKQKLYPTSYEFTKSEFRSIWETIKPRREHKDTRLELQAIEIKANEIADQLPQFTFDAFERRLFTGYSKNKSDIVYYYKNAIELYKRNRQFGTASNYELSLKSLLKFHGKKNLPFYIVTPQWLKDYERYMVENKKRSLTTVSMYVRTLRTIFNSAIADNVIDKELYPFGRRKYVVPAPKSTKRALSKEQLKLLFEATPKTPEQNKAKAFWFFSYSCNGMNFKDIANLKYKYIVEDTLTFTRIKTANINKEQSPVIVYLNDFTKSVIEQYGNKDTTPENYIFPIITPSVAPEEKHKQIKNFTRFVNQHFKKYAEANGIDAKVSTYWARHSFATNAIRNGASMEFVSEALSHSNLITTKNYFAGFEDDKKRELAEKLMEF